MMDNKNKNKVDRLWTRAKVQWQQHGQACAAQLWRLTVLAMVFLALTMVVTVTVKSFRSITASYYFVVQLSGGYTISQPHHRVFVMPENFKISYNSEDGSMNQDEKGDSDYNNYTTNIKLFTYLASPPPKEEASVWKSLLRQTKSTQHEQRERSNLFLSPNFLNYYYSAIKNGFSPPTVIQAEDKSDVWKEGAPDYLRWQARMKQYLNFAAQQKNNNDGNNNDDDSLLIFTDSLDILFVASHKHTYHAFKQIVPKADKVVFCAETLCDTTLCDTQDGCEDATSKQFMDQQAPSSTKHRYLNNGVIMGSPQMLTELFEWVLAFMKENKVDDHAAFVQFWQLHPDKLTLDYDSAICGVISSEPRHFARDWEVSPLINSLVEGKNAVQSLSSKLFDDIEISQEDRVFRQRQSGKVPAVVHFANIWYAPPTYANPDKTYSRCQKHLIHAYNVLGNVLLGESSHQDEYQAKHVQSRHRVVVSLTTTPQRLPNILPTLLTIHRQSRSPDAIYLNIPKYSKRFKQEYNVPDFLQKLPWLTINDSCKDYGPASKLICTLERETNPATLIITVDDDYLYNSDLVESLVKQHLQAPYVAFANAGQMIDTDVFSSVGIRVRSACGYKTEDDWNEPVAVDILDAFLGAIYRRDFFDLDTIVNIPQQCWTTDDIWISSLLAKKGISRVRLPFTRKIFDDENDNVAPLHVFGSSINDICAVSLLPSFQKTWSEHKHFIPLGFSSLEYPKGMDSGTFLSVVQPKTARSVPATLLHTFPSQ